MNRIIAHRGFSSHYPENTMLAFQEAFKRGCRMIELDVQLSLDNVPVVIHDEKVNRVTNGNGFVHTFTLAELRELKVMGTETIPTLKEVLNHFKGKAQLIIELKKTKQMEKKIEESVLADLVEVGSLTDVQVISFDHDCIDRLKKIAPSMLAVGYIQRKPTKRLFRRMEDQRISSVTMNYLFFSKRVVRKCKRNGYRLVFYNVTNVKQIQRCLRYPHVYVTVKELNNLPYSFNITD
ncbi:MULTISPECIES: glycerophosphodiester phosphodiesterase [Bacillaceae]|uniref:glycerophosphodiester phosphodiesterase n=1 Tax=Shouchella oshimensis TaxID=290588 RepID=UPI0006EBF494|nr:MULTISPECIES: glycerophosphodiester phosphodiesterase family protein [Bacillaceae]